ncbi:LuxR family two component transcriptional regulator [Murinocardiopsis flavida]|uniref:LuxR family two component transcriptional regulator n=1 Tax=Murinocardiopsis flavida TaxID=645275 RepID=A0A2P8DKE5_9ACTN|nr:response regulator transcription factor [Murinocardiopsis flavida]PSK97692.1 LuxR family two component transcriptional regulator [Murinocardiopsis flavida]
MGAVSATTVLLVDDDPFVRGSLTTMFGATDDLAIVAAVADGADVMDAVRRHRPDVVLMDIRMPGTDGLTATRYVLAEPDPPAVVMLTTLQTDASILAALRLGAAGFLLKDTHPAQIIDAVRMAAAGEPTLSPSVTRRLIEHVDSDSGPRESAHRLMARLTPRERDIAAAIGEGLTNGEIASRLGMSVPTVKTHVGQILAKWDRTNRVQVALIAYEAARP